MTERLESLFKEPDEEWVDWIIALTFKNQRISKELNNDTLKEALFVSARQAKLLIYLHGLETKQQLEEMTEKNHKKCLGELISKVLIPPYPINFPQEKDY